MAASRERSSVPTTEKRHESRAEQKGVLCRISNDRFSYFRSSMNFCCSREQNNNKSNRESVEPEQSRHWQRLVDKTVQKMIPFNEKRKLLFHPEIQQAQETLDRFLSHSCCSSVPFVWLHIHRLGFFAEWSERKENCWTFFTKQTTRFNRIDQFGAPVGLLPRCRRVRIIWTAFNAINAMRSGQVLMNMI